MSGFSVVTVGRGFLDMKDIVLRQRSSNVNIDDKECMVLCERLVMEMFKIMYAADGAGLAAPQIGIPLRLFVVDPTNLKFGPHVMINPVLKHISDDKVSAIEGCLSLPGVSGKVERSKNVTIEAYNLRSERIEYCADGWLARVFQHELDHLDGILYSDHLSSTDQLRQEEDFAQRRAEKAMEKIKKSA